jgi:hypothetical protein
MRKLLALFLAGAMILTLTSCGADAPETPDNGENSSENGYNPIHITEKNALSIAKEKYVSDYLYKISSSEKIDGNEYYIVHVHETIPQNSDDDEIVTYAWIYINKITGEAYRLSLSGDELIPLEDGLIAKVFEISIEEDLTKKDVEKLKRYTNITLMIEAEGVDISLLSELNNLEILAIYQGGHPSPLTTVQSFISDFSFLSGMNLISLKIHFGGFDADLNDFEFKHLETLGIYYANITSTDEIKTFPALKDMEIKFSNVKSINPFTALKLEKLFLDSVVFEQVDIDKINEISTLRELDFVLCDNFVITKLGGLTNLEIFGLFVREVDFDIEVIYELTWLKTLTIHPDIITEEQATRYKELNPDISITYYS